MRLTNFLSRIGDSIMTTIRPDSIQSQPTNSLINNYLKRMIKQHIICLSSTLNQPNKKRVAIVTSSNY